jgi:hypothetical protein
MIVFVSFTRSVKGTIAQRLNPTVFMRSVQGTLALPMLPN